MCIWSKTCACVKADLIHLGAKYSPCMRRDENVEHAIAGDRHAESQTACCIRNDHSGCVQASRSNCSVSWLLAYIFSLAYACACHLFRCSKILYIGESVHLSKLRVYFYKISREFIVSQEQLNCVSICNNFLIWIRGLIWIRVVKTAH